jgi:hypothetical protein
MIGPDRLARVTAAAVVPEQVVDYVSAVAGSQPRMFGACVGYQSTGEVVLVGYPLHDPLDSPAMATAVEEALQAPGLERITVIGPVRPPQAPDKVETAEDNYYALPLPQPPPGPKLRNLLRRAERDVQLVYGRRFEDDHAALVQRYLAERPPADGTRRIFRRLPSYLEASAGSLIVSARRADGRLAAFSVGEFAALATAFFMFCFRDSQVAPPGSADLTFSALLKEAQQRGQTRMNLGLGVSDGIRFFKRKWGAEPYLPYVETSWQPASPGLLSRLRGMLRRKPQ